MVSTLLGVLFISICDDFRFLLSLLSFLFEIFVKIS